MGGGRVRNTKDANRRERARKGEPFRVFSYLFFLGALPQLSSQATAYLLPKCPGKVGTVVKCSQGLKCDMIVPLVFCDGHEMFLFAFGYV